MEVALIVMGSGVNPVVFRKPYCLSGESSQPVARAAYPEMTFTVKCLMAVVGGGLPYHDGN